jgi:tetratricopeptide (TPR) repeat protein
MRVFGYNFVRFFTVNPIMAAKSATFRLKMLYFFFRRQFPNKLLKNCLKLMKMAFFICLVFTGFLLPLTAQNSAQNTEAAGSVLLLFEQGNAAYQAGNYAEAARFYEKITTHQSAQTIDNFKLNYHATEVYENLGNAYYRQNKRGLAVLNYKRALRFSPNNTAAQYNLTLVQTQIPQRIAPLKSFFLKNWLENIRKLLSPNIWSYLFLTALWGVAIGVAVWQLGTNRTFKKSGFISAVSMLITGLLVGILAYSSAKLPFGTTEGVVLNPQTALFSTPEKGAAVLVLLEEGQDFIVLEAFSDKSDFIKIRLPNREEGWIETRHFAAL